MTILFVTEISPFPPNKGEKLRSLGLLKLMDSMGIQVHAIVGESDNTPGENFHSLTIYPFNYKRYNKSGRYNRLFKLWPELTASIDKILNNNHINAAFIDYHFYGHYIGYLKAKGIPVIYGTHNAQAALFWQLPTNTFRLFLSKCWHYLHLRLHEIIYFRKADALIVVSENDRKYHSKILKNIKQVYVIPNFLDESEYAQSYREKENYVIMSANFSAYQNLYGLEWFVKNVWNNQLWEKTRLILVGFESSEALKIIKQKYNCVNITATGEVEDLKPYIAKAKVSIVPLLHGSGTRLKCLESMALGTQLLSTSKGAEGIEHENTITLANTPDEFRKKLLDIIDNKINTSIEANKVFMKKYSIDPNKKIFGSILENLRTSKLIN